jgi:hypothetical protein
MNLKSDNKFENELTDAAARLALEVKPERDLWPAIQQAISKPVNEAMPQRSAWNTVWAQAAAVLLLVGGSSGLTYLTMSGDNNPVSPLMTEGPALVFEPVSGSFGSQYHLGPDYLDAKRDLEASLDEQLERLSPETRDAVQANIETIRSAIEDINKALTEEPDNVLLQKLLISTYREELALMQHVGGIAKVAMYRGDI